MEREAGVALQIQRLLRLPHTSKPQLPIGELDLAATDARRAVLSNRRQGFVLERVEETAGQRREFRGLRFNLSPASHASPQRGPDLIDALVVLSSPAERLIRARIDGVMWCGIAVIARQEVRVQVGHRSWELVTINHSSTRQIHSGTSPRGFPITLHSTPESRVWRKSQTRFGGGRLKSAPSIVTRPWSTPHRLT